MDKLKHLAAHENPPMEKTAEKEADNAYTRNGYKDRADYLASLADDYGVDSYTMAMLADVMGESEDFDGLVSELEDMDYYGTLDSFRSDEE
jgi:hypothetical protein